jgi:hypothetical protein
MQDYNDGNTASPDDLMPEAWLAGLPPTTQAAVLREATRGRRTTDPDATPEEWLDALPDAVRSMVLAEVFRTTTTSPADEVAR